MFVLLKLLLVFFRPLIWVVILFVFGLMTKNLRRKRIALSTSLALLLLFSNPFFLRTALSAYEIQPVTLLPTQRYKAGILLGGMVNYVQYEDKGYFNQVSDRFLETALLYKRGQIENIVVAAGNGYITKNNFSEAGFIKRHLIDLGIPAERIFADSASRNTLENALFAKRLTDSVQVSGPYLLISSAMHLPRALNVFQKAGITATPFPCDFQGRGGGNNIFEDYLLPSSRALWQWDNLLKEWVGSIAYSITGKS